jgi:hypothetical protein
VGVLQGEARALQATIAARGALLEQVQDSARTAAVREEELLRRVEELTRMDGVLGMRIAEMRQGGGDLAPLREVRERLLLWYYSLTNSVGDSLRVDSAFASPHEVEAVWRAAKKIRSQLSNELSRLNERLGEDSPEDS